MDKSVRPTVSFRQEIHKLTWQWIERTQIEISLMPTLICKRMTIFWYFKKKCGFSQYFDGSDIKGKKSLFSILYCVRPTDDFFTIFFNFGLVYIQIYYFLKEITPWRVWNWYNFFQLFKSICSPVTQIIKCLSDRFC